MRPRIEVTSEDGDVVVTATGGTEADRTAVLLVTAGLASRAGFETLDIVTDASIVFIDNWCREPPYHVNAIEECVSRALEILFLDAK